MKTVRVDLHERGYDIRIGNGVEPGASLAGEPSRRALVVSDAVVDPLYGDRCERALRTLGHVVTRVVVPAGEETKSLDRLGELYAAAAAAGLDRRSVIVALGGGVVGDLAGFAAATYMRGVRFIQAPTSLLAMVDSSVGGKTGINLPQGKNLVGAFHQPIEVAIDLNTLATLPEVEYRAGLAEVVKYGVIWDATLFDRLEADADRLAARDAAALTAVVARCCEIKAEVVAMDERESGVRAILNFGHTLGHALETADGYGVWLHGEAVAVGMAYAAELSVRLRSFPEGTRDRLVDLLRRWGLPVSPAAKGTAPEWAALRRAMGLDKKSMDGQARFVLAEKMGSVVFGCAVEDGALADAYREWTRKASDQ
jgi:3-dehydroquinate synthase